MSYDLHFEDGKHIKFTNWEIIPFGMLLLYACGSWNKRKVASELTQYAVTRNTMPGDMKANRQTKEDIEAVEKARKNLKIHSVVTVRKVAKEDLASAVKKGIVLVDDEFDENEAEAWIAEISFRNKPTKAALEEYKQALKDGKDAVIQFAIMSAKKSDYLIEEAPKDLFDIFRKFFKNDGETINPLEAMALLEVYVNHKPKGKKEKMEVHELAEELDLQPPVALLRVLQYTIASGTCFQVH